MDEFFCRGCKKSMVGPDKVCLNCGLDLSEVSEKAHDFDDDEVADQEENTLGEDDFFAEEVDPADPFDD